MEQTLTFGDVARNKKSFHKNIKPIELSNVNINIFAINKFTIEGMIKYFIGYKTGNKIRPLSINTNQMGEYVKYFENGKAMNFAMKEDNDIYRSILDKVKELMREFNIKKSHSDIFYGNKYLKIKIKEYKRVVKAVFTNEKLPKENKHYYCLANIKFDWLLFSSLFSFISFLVKMVYYLLWMIIDDYP